MTAQGRIHEKQKELFELCKENQSQCLILVDNKDFEHYNVYINLNTNANEKASESDYLRLINNLSEVVFKLSKGNCCIKSTLDTSKSVS